MENYPPMNGLCIDVHYTTYEDIEVLENAMEDCYCEE